MARSRDFKPTNDVENELYDFYLKWRKWWDEYYAIRDKKFGKEEILQENSIAFDKEYTKSNAKPKIPNLIEVDFAYRDVNDNLLRRLQDGYYRLPKVIVIKSEYDTTTYLVNKHEDMAEVVLRIFNDIKEGLIWIENPEEVEPAWTIPQDILAKIPESWRDQIKDMQKTAQDNFVGATKYYKLMKRLCAQFEKAKKGDAIAAADILAEIYHHLDTDGNDLKITIQVPHNLEPKIT